MSNNTKTLEKYEHALDTLYQVFKQMSGEIADLRKQLHEPGNDADLQKWQYDNERSAGYFHPSARVFSAQDVQELLEGKRLVATLPASSEPEQTKCKTCKDTGEVASYPDEIYCPENCEAARKLMADCARPKCVCKFNNSSSVCGAPFLDWGDGTCGRLSPGTKSLMACGHLPGCHTPAPAAKEVNNDSSMD